MSPPAAESAPAAPGGAGTVAVVDMGATSIRLLVAEIAPDSRTRILDQAYRGVMLGKDTFTIGRLSATTIEAALRVLEGFRKIMDGYGVKRVRAVATSAVREAANRDAFLDRIRLRTGLEFEIIDGAEENRLTYLAVREGLKGRPDLAEDTALLVEVGGGSTDVSVLARGEPSHSGTYPLGAIRLRQGLGSFRGGRDQEVKLLRRRIRNAVGELARDLPLGSARHFLALGGDARFAASRILGEEAAGQAVRALPRPAFESFCEEMAHEGEETLLARFGLAPAAVETLVPALLVFHELLSRTPATEVLVLPASLRAGVLLDMAGGEQGERAEDFRRQVIASATALGEKYRYDAAHGRRVADLAVRLFDELRQEHGLAPRHRLLLEVAALLHDVGGFIRGRGHHKHSLYILSESELFGLSREDMAIVGHVARYHRRATPQASHPLYMGLDRTARVDVLKLAAILRLVNALDAEHLQKVQDFRLVRGEDVWRLEIIGAGDLTMERLAVAGRSDLFTEVFGARIAIQEPEPSS